MSLTNSENIRYLKISDGKIREKTSQDNPKAVQRFVAIANEGKGAYMYELEYNSCSGYIESLTSQEHPEYGTSYYLTLRDTDSQKYCLQISENSRYFRSLVMHLPNIDLSKQVEVFPYAIAQRNGKKNIGISFKQEDEKIENYYKSWDADKEKSIYKNGLEKYDFSKVQDDKDERKILQVRFTKFLRSELSNQITRIEKHASKFSNITNLEDKNIDKNNLNDSKKKKNGKKKRK